MNPPRTAAGRQVQRRLAALLPLYLPPGGRPTSAGARALAVLRRARPDDMAADPDSWEFTIADAPAELLGDTGEPTVDEAATHAALSLFARHQQGRGRPMHVQGPSLGSATRDLARAVGGEESVAAESMLVRFRAVGAADTRSQRLHHLRTFISLLRANDIPLDYARLADDLVRLESPRTARTTRLTWSRDLHRLSAATSDEASTETDIQHPTTEIGDPA